MRHKGSRRALMCAVLTVLTANAAAQQLSVRCAFPKGIATNFDTGVPRSKTAGANDLPDLVFDQIDVSKGKARMIGNVGADGITALRGGDSINLIEQTNFGNMNFTTIFAISKLDAARPVPVVHSRHQNTPSGPFVSQYWGTCKRLL